jgi:hypothetical protein
MEEYKLNVAMVLKALTAAQLYCSIKKSTLFTSQIDFLGHHILQKGIEVDTVKVMCILNWPSPKSAKDVHQFLGLVRYIAHFLPSIAEHTSLLTPLTRKECNRNFPTWTSAHQYAFEAIKRLVGEQGLPDDSRP